MNTIRLTGKIVFDPEDKTNKHANQASWKKIAMVLIGGDVCEYYSWFIKKRYGISLHKPLRGAHITFINDRTSDMNGKWGEIKKKWQGKTIEITIDLTPKTSIDKNPDLNWWFTVPNEHRESLHDIRNELGLGRPFFGLHLTIGRAVDYTPDHFEDGVMKAKEMNTEQSKWIYNAIVNGFIN